VGQIFPIQSKAKRFSKCLIWWRLLDDVKIHFEQNPTLIEISQKI